MDELNEIQTQTEASAGHVEFDAIRIGLASPEKILSWSYGEVKKPETINYRTLKPERDGLFCEKIFGPTKDWECHCGKYKRVRYKGKICEKCGVEVTRKKVRRERMGHIELAAPVSHIWYFRGTPSRMGLILNISPRLLEKVIYFAAYIVIDGGDTPLKTGELLSEREYTEMREKYENDFEAGMGADAVRKMLERLDLEQLEKELREELENSNGQKRIRLLKRLEVVEAFLQSGNRPEWMIMTVLPVIPPEIRPMVQLDGGRFATSDLNDLYRRVINRNNRLKKLLELHAPEIIVRNEKRMLQEAVDALIDNGRRGRPVTGPNNRALKSLSDMLKGKQGRFRQNLLGKRVDYSGRSVIVVGPNLKIYQCGLPKEMALELFKPFVMKRLVETGQALHIRDAKKKVERVKDEVWDALEVVIKEHPVLLNRAPTLHRLSIQAFEPVLVEGRSIKLHPLVCTAFNADFDGDQMPVHVPLSAEAQAEARFLMLSANNLLKPQDGRPVTVPTQDMVLGSYYLTSLKEGDLGGGKYFRDPEEALLCYQSGGCTLHAPIRVRVTKERNGVMESHIIDATVGRLLFNENIPQDLGFVDRSKEENYFNLEITFTTTKKKLGEIIARCIEVHGTAKTAEILDKIKEMGFKYSTKGALTISVADMTVPAQKKVLIAKAEADVAEVKEMFEEGLLTDEERYKRVVKIWEQTTNDVTQALKENLDRFNPIFMMFDSGARGSMNQIRQLAGMRGLMSSTTGRIIERPIRANFREGLDVIEYFVAARGARKGLSDTALRTADSGYLTRRLVDVAQDVIVREEDCGTDQGIWVKDIRDGRELLEKLRERIVGRYAAADVAHPETGELLVARNEMITPELADRIVDAGIEEVYVRSVMTCGCRHGVCAKCYGLNLAMNRPVNVGEAVGIIAAQSIGEPGTQLTMRTFHTGGVASSDITQGLPRVEELFEARRPKNSAIVSEIDGTLELVEEKKAHKARIVGESEVYETLIPFGRRIIVTNGEQVKKGQPLTEGAIAPQDLLYIFGEAENGGNEEVGKKKVFDYITREVQRIYRMEAIDINDKHVEVIVRQMFRKKRVDDPGDTGLLPLSEVDVAEFEAANAEIRRRIENGETELREAVGMPVLKGITKASLATDSFLSAASFQQTTSVLTDAAIKGKTDYLIGLKENVIIGKLIPAGTGIQSYNEVEVIPTYAPVEGNPE